MKPKTPIAPAGRNLPVGQSLNDAFQVFIGIDQTGATSDQGKTARPFPVSVLLKVKDQWILKAANKSGEKLKLKSLSEEDLSDLLQTVFFEASGGEAQTPALDQRVCLFIDGVFGLAKDAWPKNHEKGLEDLWSLFRKAQTEFELYGLKPAASFFSGILRDSNYQGSAPYPVRHCEVLANANSVFRTHPYQKNIQCGTFRIWRDLGRTKAPWLNIRFFTPRSEALKERPWAFEAYPSYLWREIFELKNRQPAAFGETIRSRYPKVLLTPKDEAVIAKNPDWADAAILALGAFVYQKKGALFQSAPHRKAWLRKEGWIIGLDLE